MNAASEYYRNKLAVVTGGASGIGLALAEMMLGYGATRVVLADFNDENLKREAARLNAAYPGKVAGVHCNVTKEADVQSMIRQAAEFDGRIDLLFNNAGAGFNGYFDRLTNEDWEKAFALNFYGALYGVRAVLPIMRQQGGGHIVNIISGIAFSPMAQTSGWSLAMPPTCPAHVWRKNCVEPWWRCLQMICNADSLLPQKKNRCPSCSVGRCYMRDNVLPVRSGLSCSEPPRRTGIHAGHRGRSTHACRRALTPRS